MLSVKVKLKNAEKVKTYLFKNGLFNKDYKFLKIKDSIFFPITSKGNLEKKFSEIKLIDKKFEKHENKQKLKDFLEKKLTKKELGLVKRSFDVVGDIAIIEVPKELVKKQKSIAQILINQHKNIKVVLKKSSIHEGTFRTQKLQHIAGEKRKETIYKENQVSIKLDVEKVYFSARLSTERKRIAELVKKNEEVLVMFSGCGIYPVVISKNTSAKNITGIEINPIGHKYALKNIELNKINNVTFIQGDVRKKYLSLKQKFDRILMPLPMGAEEYLDIALKLSKPKAVVHFYDFLDERNFPKESVDKVKKACIKYKKKCKIKKSIKCGQYSPMKYRVCIDFIVS